MKPPVIRYFSLPNGSKIMSLRESTLRAGLKAANTALKAERRRNAMTDPLDVTKVSNLSRFDAAEYLDSSEARAEYFRAAVETEDVAFITDAIGIAARAIGMSQAAKEAGAVCGGISMTDITDEYQGPAHSEAMEIGRAFNARYQQTMATLAETNRDTPPSPVTDITGYTFRVVYSHEDAEWVATCDQLPSLSFLHHDMVEALERLHSVVADYVDDINEPTPPSPSEP